jgi:hypothetical protein
MKDDQLGYPPRGMDRIVACRYLALPLSVFDELVKSGAMPPPKLVGKRHVWDRIALDVSFASLPDLEQDTRTNLEKLIDSRRN